MKIEEIMEKTEQQKIDEGISFCKECGAEFLYPKDRLASLHNFLCENCYQLSKVK
jgi:formylmethanofuran dehydrogenase subunit E